MGAKLVCKLYKESNSSWATLMFAKYLARSIRESIFIASSLTKGSSIWSFMVKCRSVILPYLSWVIHNGRKARFWDEVSNGHSTLVNVRD